MTAVAVIGVLAGVFVVALGALVAFANIEYQDELNRMGRKERDEFKEEERRDIQNW